MISSLGLDGCDEIMERYAVFLIALTIAIIVNTASIPQGVQILLPKFTVQKCIPFSLKWASPLARF
jgi:hypothetical protein